MKPDWDVIKQKTAATKIDLNGHMRNGKLFRDDRWPERHIYQDVKWALYDHFPWPEGMKKSIHALQDCYDCGQDIDFEYDGENARVLTPCPYPEGRGELVFELNIPSGKMAVANDLRDIFRVMGDHNINGLDGIFRTSMDYADVGLAHCYVGNTCPGVYRINNESFVIGTNSSRGRNPVKRSRSVASICTDLWWYSICDHDELMRRSPDEKNVDVVKCKPGVYKFRHVYHLTDRDDYKSAAVYTYIDWVRESDPLRDYAAAYNALNLTAGQVILDKIKCWPTLYGEGTPIQNMMRAADHLLCVGGSGANYHPNGFWASSPLLKNDSPDCEIPAFEEKHHWYPFSETSVIGMIAGFKSIFGETADHVNDSFIALAFNICRCILLYGVDRSDGHEQSILDTAKKCMHALKVRYPTKVPVNCIGVE